MVVVRQQVVIRECWTEADAVAASRERFGGTVTARRGPADTGRQLVLRRALEDEVIPRLLLAQRVAPANLVHCVKLGCAGRSWAAERDPHRRVGIVGSRTGIANGYELCR